MPHKLFYSLYIKLINRLSTDEGKNATSAESLEDMVEEGMMGI